MIIGKFTLILKLKSPLNFNYKHKYIYIIIYYIFLSTFQKIQCASVFVRLNHVFTNIIKYFKTYKIDWSAYRRPPFGIGRARTGDRPRSLPNTTACRSLGRRQVCTWARWSCHWICTVRVRFRSSLPSCWTSIETPWLEGQLPPRKARPCSRPGTRRSPSPGPSCSQAHLRKHDQN